MIRRSAEVTKAAKNLARKLAELRPDLEPPMMVAIKIVQGTRTEELAVTIANERQYRDGFNRIYRAIAGVWAIVRS